MAKGRSHVDDLRGAGKLAVEATRGVTDLVRAMHERIASGPALLGKPLAGPAAAMTGLLYGSIRGVTQLVGAGVDLALAQLGPLLGQGVPGAEREAVLAALNGVLGDYLAETGNPLAIQMELRQRGHALELKRDQLCTTFPTPPRKLLLLVHGSSLGDLQWTHHGYNLGAVLAERLGVEPLYLRYNSGLHISTNGRAFAALLDALVKEWPVPIDGLTLVAHSMGGLVCRSACAAAEQSGLSWLSQLKSLVCLGSPHHGAPLERGGNLIDVLLGVSSYSAPLARLGKIRSAGVTDLRYGSVADEDWQGRDRFAHAPDSRKPVPLPANVRCFAVAGTTALALAEKLPGDGLVPVSSALGRHPKPELTLAFPPEHQWVALGLNHLDLIRRPEVAEVLARWLSDKDVA